MKRSPCAIGFYGGDVKGMLEEFLDGYEPPPLARKPVSAVVPHAGWVFSGAVAAKVFAALCRPEPPSTFVLLGAVYSWGVDRPSIFPEGSWRTPRGEVEVDAGLAASIGKALGDLAVVDPGAHSGEHSIEVQVPMIEILAPGSKIVPIALPPTKEAAALGDRLGAWAAEQETSFVVVASTDLTHYGKRYGMAPAGEGDAAEAWMKANDRRIIDKALALDAEAIVPEAQAHHNACGAGAMAASVAFARALGREAGTLIAYTTSHEVMPEGRFRMAVGYAGIVF